MATDATGTGTGNGTAWASEVTCSGIAVQSEGTWAGTFCKLNLRLLGFSGCPLFFMF